MDIENKPQKTKGDGCVGKRLRHDGGYEMVRGTPRTEGVSDRGIDGGSEHERNSRTGTLRNQLTIA